LRDLFSRGTLDASHFIANGTGPLYYDADGSGNGAAVAVAVFNNGFVLKSTDIHLIWGAG